ncbi:MAG: trypsin-like peptidase domain-containing protein, partial [Planctomycetes bacterium]|nr:trypsin-like peptidase domain-containing protein [Planctomycetota bacterium]
MHKPENILISMAIALLATTCAAAATRRTPVVEAVEKCSPAVVNISSERVIRQQYGPLFGHRDRMFDQLFREFRQRYHGHERLARSLGSGVIVDPSGIVVTNEHVINRASKITVTLVNGRRYEARLISSDPENDLAVLQIDAPEPLPCIQMGTSSDLMIGETIIAMGNPMGLENSVAAGVLSATDRSVAAEGKVVLEHLIQIDATINPGNSGGALVNINGELIGINTAIVADAQGIGFALPVDRVKNVLVNLLDYRLHKRMWLGVRLQEITPDIAEQLN